jgi:hypothetical protein
LATLAEHVSMVRDSVPTEVMTLIELFY